MAFSKSVLPFLQGDQFLTAWICSGHVKIFVHPNWWWRPLFWRSALSKQHSNIVKAISITKLVYTRKIKNIWYKCWFTWIDLKQKYKKEKIWSSYPIPSVGHKISRRGPQVAYPWLIGLYCVIFIKIYGCLLYDVWLVLEYSIFPFF